MKKLKDYYYSIATTKEVMKELLLVLLFTIPLTANAEMLGFNTKFDGAYNIDTSTSELTGEVGRTIGMYGFSVTGDIDFDLIEFAYDGMDFKAEYDILDANSTSLYISSGLDTNWGLENIVIGFTAEF
tara:strand:+ start:1744 stop:2127 length:384 start_codon:yes stop_codon:yes gene_type:complete